MGLIRLLNIAPGHYPDIGVCACSSGGSFVFKHRHISTHIGLQNPSSLDNNSPPFYINQMFRVPLSEIHNSDYRLFLGLLIFMPPCKQWRSSKFVHRPLGVIQFTGKPKIGDSHFRLPVNVTPQGRSVQTMTSTDCRIKMVICARHLNI